MTSVTPMVTAPDLGLPLEHPMKLRVPSAQDTAGGLFGARREGGRRSHAGIDLLAEVGDPVYAVLRGRVSLVRDETVNLPSGDMYLSIVHNAVQDGLVTRYVHLQNIVVAPGETVEAGTLLGEIGKSSLPHLHFETRRIIDPGSSIWAGGKENWKNRRQHIASVPVDPTREMYNWEARIEGFSDTGRTEHHISEIGVLHKNSVIMFQIKWGGKYYQVPLYEPIRGEIELVSTLRSAFVNRSKVRLATRTSYFFAKRMVITAARVR